MITKTVNKIETIAFWQEFEPEKYTAYLLNKARLNPIAAFEAVYFNS